MAYYTESDPRFAPRMEFMGDGDVLVTPPVPHERVWIALARQEGVEPTVLSGSGDMQAYVVNPAYVAWKENKKAQGFDVGMQDIPGTNYSKQAVILQNGQPIGEPFNVKTGNTLLEGAIELAPIVLAAVGGQFLGAGGTASAAGQQAALTAGNVLGGATAALPAATGAGAIGAAGAGAAGAGIAEGMAPGVLAPATAAETAGVNALLTGGAGVTGAAGAGAAGIAEGMAPGVVAPATAAELAGTEAVLTGAGAAGAGAAGAGAAGAGAAGAGAAGAGAAGAGAAGAGAAGAGAAGAAGSAAAGAAGAAAADSFWGPLISSLASLYGGQQMAEAANRAAELYSQQMADALKLQRDIYEQGVERQRPFLEQGTAAFNRLVDLQTGGPEAAQNFLQMDPGYGFRLSEGMKALERQQAARGNLLSGGAIKAGQRYAQDVASQEYGNAYNRLAQLANVGPAAAGVTNALGQNYATGASNLMSQQGEVGANALLTGAAARQSSYGNVGKAWSDYFNPPPVYTRYMGG